MYHLNEEIINVNYQKRSGIWVLTGVVTREENSTSNANVLVMKYKSTQVPFISSIRENFKHKENRTFASA